MQVNPVELSFPCPACGIRLTIQQTSADGPCPHCNVAIQVELKASLRKPSISSDEEVVYLENSFDRRRFRPASQPSHTRSQMRHHPSQI